jgi:hypothetical protein
MERSGKQFPLSSRVHIEFICLPFDVDKLPLLVRSQRLGRTKEAKNEIVKNHKPINEISHDTRCHDTQLLFCGFLNEF